MLWPGSKPDCKDFRILAAVLFCHRFPGIALSVALPISERWARSQLHSQSFQDGNAEKWSLKPYCSWCVICKSPLVFCMPFFFVLLTVTISWEQQYLGISWPSLPYLGGLDGSERHEFLRPKPPTLICLKINIWNTIFQWQETLSLNDTKISGDATNKESGRESKWVVSLSNEGP